MTNLRRQDLVYPELSYQIIGCSFDVHNEIGGGHHEKYYQRALCEAFKKKRIKFKQQVYFPLYYDGKIIGQRYIDFLVEDKIIVELKKGNRYSKKHIDQVLNYMKSSNIKLAILINFGLNEVSFRRIVNFDS